jgi:hypothetical protein
MTRKAPQFKIDIRAELDRLMANHRVTLLTDKYALTPRRDPAAIVSSVPAMTVQTGAALYAGRRQRIRLEGGSGHVTLLTRTRKLASFEGPSRSLVQCGVDRFGRPVPVSILDFTSQTLHLLVDLREARLVETSSEIDPAALVVEQIYGRAVAALLSEDHRAWVGPDVHSLARTILGNLHASRRKVVQDELSHLENLAAAHILPAALTRRVQTLRNWLGGRETAPPEASSRREGRDEANIATMPPTSEQVELEVSRLAQLVTSRACGVIHLGQEEITGLVNPRALGRSFSRPVLFRLALSRFSPHPALRLWNPLRPARQGDAPCLGQGALMLCDCYKTRDLYALVDLILNFLETNRIEIFTIRGRGVFVRWMEALAELF